jgi:crossover junction endodeoxyribonuclease RuvC
MRIMGVDISSRNTGWCVVDVDELNKIKLVDYGAIHPSTKMTMCQKITLFDFELDKIIKKYCPDEIAIEDVILCKSIKTAILLGRFNGVALRLAYSFNRKEPSLYIPSEWKKSLLGCDGGSSKAEIQLSICETFDLITEKKYQYFIHKINEAKMVVAELDREELKVLRSRLASEKRKKESDKKQIKFYEKEISNVKRSFDVQLKDRKKQMDNELESVSLEIYTETGISDDIADSIGVALKKHYDLEN